MLMGQPFPNAYGAPLSPKAMDELSKVFGILALIPQPCELLELTVEGPSVSLMKIQR